MLTFALNTKIIKVFPNQKPWLDKNVRSLLKPSGQVTCREQKKGITDAKQIDWQCIESYFGNKKPCSMWRSIKPY